MKKITTNKPKPTKLYIEVFNWIFYVLICIGAASWGIYIFTEIFIFRQIAAFGIGAMFVWSTLWHFLGRKAYFNGIDLPERYGFADAHRDLMKFEWFLDMNLALKESVKLQAHYAELLNMHDGGKRRVFKTVKAWVNNVKRNRKKHENKPK